MPLWSMLIGLRFEYKYNIKKFQKQIKIGYL